MSKTQSDTLRLCHGVLVRKERHDDANMVRECIENYKYFTFRSSDVVMDLGVNVGGFTVMALANPIRKYVGYEPDPENHLIAVTNASRNNLYCVDWHIHMAAVSRSTENKITFYQTESGNAKCSGTVSVTARSAAARKIRREVLNYSFDRVMWQYEPTIVKMDIEGAEYGWFADNHGVLPKHIREIAFDLHRLNSGLELFETEYLPNILKDFELVHASANTAFEGKKGLGYEFKGLGLKGNGVVYAVDTFFRRK